MNCIKEIAVNISKNYFEYLKKPVMINLIVHN